MKTKSLGIQEITYGEVRRFYPLKFKRKENFEDLCKLILKSKIVYTDSYREDIMDSLGCSLSHTIKSMQNKNVCSSDMIFRMQDFDRYNKMDPDSITPNENVRVELESTGFSVKMHVYDTEIEEIEQQISNQQREEEMVSDIYGKKFVSLQDRFVLLPIKTVLNNGKQVYVRATLYVFANGMGFVQLSIPLVNIGIETLINNNLDSIISKITYRWGNKEDILISNIHDVLDIYTKALIEDTGINFQLYGNTIDYISLISYDEMPKQINNLPNKIQEDLYLIIAAPVLDREVTSHIKEAQDCIRKYSWGGHNINYIVKKTGGCLSYIDQSLFERVVQEYKEKNNITDLNDKDYYSVYNIIATDLFANVEFAILLIMLKKINDCECYYEKVFGLNELSKIQKEYNENILFISELQEYCYGSASEQIEFFEKSMCYYLKQNIMDKKLAAIDNIIKDEEKKKEEKFQNFLAIGGFLITLLFGLPAIYDTLVIIRKAFAFLPYNVPFFTLEDISLFFWIVLNGTILIKVLREYISSKNGKVSN